MKILFVIPTLGGGGAEILIGSIAEQLHRIGHNVKIVCLNDHHYTYDNFPNKNYIDTHIKPEIIKSSVSFKFIGKAKVDNIAYKNFVEKYKPDVIHSSLYQSELVVYSLIQPNVKYFSYGHDNMVQLDSLSLSTLFTKRKLTNFYESLWLKARYRKARTTFVAISQDSYQFYRSNLPKSIRSRVVLLPNAIDLNSFSSGRKNKTFTLVSVGNLVPKKGHSLLIDTVYQLKLLGIEVQLFILGYGELMKVLQEQAKKLEISHLIHLEGNVPNVKEYLKKAHLYVHSATYEPFGLAIVEAMASSLPVVSTDGKGNRDLIVDGYNGYLLKHRNSELFANLIKKLLFDIELRSNLERNALEFSKKYGIEQYVIELIELYKLEQKR